MKTHERIIVIGAGLVGTFLALCLAEKGYKVDIYEKNGDVREAGFKDTKSSINLTLSHRGLKALDRMGLRALVLRHAVPIYGRLVHTTDKSLIFQPYGNNNEALYSISRNVLNKILIDFAEQHFDVHFNFKMRCIDVDLITTRVKLQNMQSGGVVWEKANRIFGVDGAFSTVRLHMQKTKQFNYSQHYIEQGYKELNVAETMVDGWPKERNVLHLWPRGRYVLIGFPKIEGGFNLSLHMPLEGEVSFEAIKTTQDLEELFVKDFSDVLPATPDLIENYFTHPTNSMITIRCDPWTFEEKVALVGDAAHAMVPYYGQGANIGFEDCLVLSGCLEKNGCAWRKTFSDYETLRKPNTDAIADLALEHFNELSDSVSDPNFLRRKEIEAKVNQLYPQTYAPLYSMIAFSCMPFIEALRAEREQRALIDQIMSIVQTRKKWEDQDIENLIHQSVCRSLPAPSSQANGSGIYL